MKSKIKLNLISWMLFIIISSIMILPFYKYGAINSGVDLSFHLNRIVNLSETLRHGRFFSYIATWGLNGIGVPINMTYGCLPIYPFAILFNIFHNEIYAYYTGIVFWLVISNIIAFSFGNKYWKNYKKSFLFAITYTFTNYLFGNFFRIGDIGQAVAWIFMPMLIWGCFSTFIQNDQKREWYYVPLALSAIIYTHVISTIIAISIVGVFLIISIMEKTDLAIKLKLVLKQIVFTLGATSFYWVNLFIALKNNINIPSCPVLSGIQVSEYIQQQLSWGGNSLGAIVTIIFVIGLFNWKKLNNYSKGTAILAIVYSFLMTNISTIILQVLSHTPFRMIQWTGRLMGAVNLFSIIFVVETIEIILQESNFKKFIYIGTVGLFLVDFLGQEVSFIHNNNLSLINYTPALNHVLPFGNWKINSNYGMKCISSKNYTGVGCTDYWPQKSLKSRNSIIDNEVFVNGKRKDIPIDKKVDAFVLDVVNINKGSKVNTPILYNNHFKVIQNNRVIPYTQSNRGTVMFTMDEKGSAIKIEYKAPKISILCATLSIITLIVLLILVFK